MGIQYFNSLDFDNFYPIENNDLYEKISLVVTDSYNEEEVSKSIKRIGFNICAAVAIQLSIVGYGQKTYGKFCFEGKEKDIHDFFRENNVKINSTLGTKLEESDLTPGRLIRFFRFYIQKFIEKTGKESYLYKKYCLEKKDNYRTKIFRGCEYLLTPGEDEEIVIGLMKTYFELDRRIEKNISDRVKRILLGKGFTNEFLDKIKPF
jgi:hypothetical protein